MESAEPGPPARKPEAFIFDLDGVVTRTAALHAAAWKRMFDEFLEAHASRQAEPFRPFDGDEDYRRLVDGRPRNEGVQSFLESRAIALPYGEATDPPDRDTVFGLGNRKNALFQMLLTRDGVAVFEGSVAFIRTLVDRGIRTALVSSSRNAAAVLAAAGIAEMFEARIDGVEAARLGLAGKPRPDTFLEAARRLGVAPERSAVVEDAISGVAAGRAGHFGLVIGVARSDDENELLAGGADLVVRDLAELGDGADLEVRPRPEAAADLPDALDRMSEIRSRLMGKRPAVFLDYDGTLTPIVSRPDLALLPDAMRATVNRLAAVCPVAIVSGRDRADVARLVGLDGLVYAGSHGFDIAGPGGLRKEHERAAAFKPALDEAEISLRAALVGIEGVLIERKKFAIAIHYRLVGAQDVARVEVAVQAVAAAVPDLRRTSGKMVHELRPRLEWDKGRAVLWLLTALGLDGGDVVPLYLGDDDTDEDAFVALRDRGIGILVTDTPHATAATYRLADPQAVDHFLGVLADTLQSIAA